VSKKPTADVSRGAGEEDWCVHAAAYSSSGRMSLSITRMTPDANVSVSLLTAFASRL
jgi:hypothetical protein